MNKVVLENEQLKLEVNEMKAKLKEKRETEEFEMLEKKTQKEHEVRCTEIQIDKNSVYSIFFEELSQYTSTWMFITGGAKLRSTAERKNPGFEMHLV